MKKIYVKATVLAASIVASVAFVACDEENGPTNLGSGFTPATTLTFSGKQVVDYSVWVGDAVNGGTLVSSGSILPENTFGSVYQELVADEDNKMLGTYTLTPDMIVYSSPSTNEQNAYQIVGDTLFVQGFVYVFGTADGGVDKRIGLLHYAGNGIAGNTTSSNTYATLEQGLAALGYTSLADMTNVGDTIAIYNISYMYQPVLQDPNLPEQPSQPQPYSKSK